MTEGQLGGFVDFAYGKNLAARNRKPGSVPVYGSAGVVGSHDVPLVKGPGIVVGRKGTIGSVHWVDQDFFPIDTTYYVVPKNSDLQMQYVYYLLKTLPLSKMNTDVAVPGLNRNNALSLKVSIPSFIYQERVVSILSRYDDLIENNRRRIQLLEQAARLLYKEWFVHLPDTNTSKSETAYRRGGRRKKFPMFVKLSAGEPPQPRFPSIGVVT